MVLDQVLTANPCPPELHGSPDLDCDMLIPIFVEANTSHIRVVAVGVFRVTGNGLGNPNYHAEFVGEVTQVADG